MSRIGCRAGSLGVLLSLHSVLVTLFMVVLAVMLLRPRDATWLRSRGDRPLWNGLGWAFGSFLVRGFRFITSGLNSVRSERLLFLISGIGYSARFLKDPRGCQRKRSRSGPLLSVPRAKSQHGLRESAISRYGPNALVAETVA